MKGSKMKTSLYATEPLIYNTKTQPLLRWHTYGDIQANDLLKHREEMVNILMKQDS